MEQCPLSSLAYIDLYLLSFELWKSEIGVDREHKNVGVGVGIHLSIPRCGQL